MGDAVVPSSIEEVQAAREEIEVAPDAGEYRVLLRLATNPRNFFAVAFGGGSLPGLAGNCALAAFLAEPSSKLWPARGPLTRSTRAARGWNGADPGGPRKYSSARVSRRSSIRAARSDAMVWEASGRGKRGRNGAARARYVLPRTPGRPGSTR